MAYHLERTGDPPGNNIPMKPKMQRRSQRIANRMAGRPGEQAAGQHLKPLQVLVDERDREGAYRTGNSQLRDDGGSPKPQGRLSPDVADGEPWPVNSDSGHHLLSPKLNINIGTWNVRTLHQAERNSSCMKSYDTSGIS